MTQPGPLSPRTLALKHSEPRVEVGGADASLPPRPEAHWFVLLPGAPACQSPLHSWNPLFGYSLVLWVLPSFVLVH